jgi:hypothetical protein
MSHKDLEGMSGLCLIGNLEVTEELAGLCLIEY